MTTDEDSAMVRDLPCFAYRTNRSDRTVPAEMRGLWVKAEPRRSY